MEIKQRYTVAFDEDALAGHHVSTVEAHAIQGHGVRDIAVSGRLRRVSRSSVTREFIDMSKSTTADRTAQKRKPASSRPARKIARTRRRSPKLDGGDCEATDCPVYTGQPAYGMGGTTAEDRAITESGNSGIGPEWAGPARPIQIRIIGRLASVDPAPVDLLIPHLRAARRFVGHVAGSVGAVHAIQDKAFYNFDAFGHLIVPAGLVPRVATILQGHGHAIEVRDDTEPRVAWRTRKKLFDRLAPEEQAYLTAIAGNRIGQIVVRRPSDALRRIALLTRFAPRAVIHVVVASRGEARRLRRQLSRRLAEPVGLLTGGYYYTQYRILICTFSSLVHHAPDVVVLANGLDAVAERPGQSLTGLTNQRIYGFIGCGVQLGAHTRLRLESQLGPVIDSVPDPAGHVAKVRVLVAESPLIDLPGRMDALDRKRRVVWHHDRRNAAVAEIAEALAAGRLEPLWQHGLLLDSEEELLHSAVPGPCVAVLVESPEHGRALNQFLPDWRLLAGVAAAGERTTSLDRAIVTLVHAASLKQLDVDVLLRADAGACSIDCIEGFLPRSGRASDNNVLLVDLGDDVDAVTAAATRRRLRDYDRRGWQIEAPTRWMSIS